MRILLVEDNLLLRHHLSVQLQSLGHLVDSAADAREADYFCQEHELDLAIVDLGLPDEDGLSLIQRWRGNNITFPILILTARGNWPDKVAGLEAGADDYMVKPFHKEEMRARLNALKRGPELPPLDMPRDRIAMIETTDDPLIPPAMRDAVRDLTKAARG